MSKLTCPNCGHTLQKDNDFYYWCHNKHAHFIIFRHSSEQLGIRATVKPEGAKFRYEVHSPQWYAKQVDIGVKETLEAAKAEADKILKDILAWEFREEMKTH
jgi:hypothetical protein